MLHQHKCFTRNCPQSVYRRQPHAMQPFSEWTVLSYLVVTKHLALTRADALRASRDGAARQSTSSHRLPAPLLNSAQKPASRKRSHACGCKGSDRRRLSTQCYESECRRTESRWARLCCYGWGAAQACSKRRSKAHNVNVRETICRHNEGNPYRCGLPVRFQTGNYPNPAAELVIKRAEGKGRLHIPNRTPCSGITSFPPLSLIIFILIRIWIGSPGKPTSFMLSSRLLW